jgi:hypothetical protein
VRREIPRPLALRAPAFLLFSGSAAGLAWATLIAAVTVALVAAGHLIGVWHLSSFTEHIQLGVGISFYGLFYALAGLLIQRRLLASRVGLEYTWAIGLFFLALGSMVSLVIEILAYSDAGARFESGLWQVLNPFALGNEVVREAVVYLGAAAVLPLMVVSRKWFLSQVRAFKPPHEEHEPGDLS